MILFLSKYPHTKEEFRDGFFQRVVDIDSFFKNDERVYLNVQLFRNYSKTIVKEDNKTEHHQWRLTKNKGQQGKQDT